MIAFRAESGLGKNEQNSELEMVVETILKSALSKYFKILFKNYNEDDLSLSLVSGEANMTNISKLISIGKNEDFKIS